MFGSVWVVATHFPWNKTSKNLNNWDNSKENEPFFSFFGKCKNLYLRPMFDGHWVPFPKSIGEHSKEGYKIASSFRKWSWQNQIPIYIAVCPQANSSPIGIPKALDPDALRNQRIKQLPITSYRLYTNLSIFIGINKDTSSPFPKIQKIPNLHWKCSYPQSFSKIQKQA